MWTDAFAQAGGGTGSPNPTVTLLLQLLQFLPIFLILYFLLIRPQQQRNKQHQKLMAGLAKGDRVLTSGGIFGTVVGVDDTKAVLRIAEDIKVEFAKNAIVQVLGKDGK